MEGIRELIPIWFGIIAGITSTVILVNLAAIIYLGNTDEEIKTED